MAAAGFLAGKRGLVMGVANNRSIAWGIAKACREHGAELAFTYQGDALKKRVEPLAAEIGAHVIGHCDVGDGDDPIFSLLEDLARRIDGLERRTTNLSEDMLFGNQESHRMRSRCAVASLLLVSCGLLAGAWVNHKFDAPGARSGTSHDRLDFTQSGRVTQASRVLK